MGGCCGSVLWVCFGCLVRCGLVPRVSFAVAVCFVLVEVYVWGVLDLLGFFVGLFLRFFDVAFALQIPLFLLVISVICRSKARSLSSL